jgi:hypothetical protein
MHTPSERNDTFCTTVRNNGATIDKYYRSGDIGTIASNIMCSVWTEGTRSILMYVCIHVHTGTYVGVVFAVRDFNFRVT